MMDKKALDTKIGQRIKKARESAGLTQDKFAELIGMGTKNVSAIERGLAGISVPALKRICETLYISSDTLIMCESDNCYDDSLNFLAERLKCLSPQQFRIAVDMNNKLFEAFSLQAKD